jgi:N-acetylmuramoyl-L-alanine amidase
MLALNNSSAESVNKTMNRRMFNIFTSQRTRAMRQGMPCVGLIVLLGVFSFVVMPDDNFLPNPKSAGGWAEQRVIPANGPPTVVIDPGHGGIDDGTKYFGLAEKDVTLDVAERLERLLKTARVATVLTRRDNVYVSLPARAEIANKLAQANQNVIFVSIHFNQSAVESVDGIETYYADQKLPLAADWTWIGFFNHPEYQALDRGENLAADMQSAMVSQMQLTNRGVKSRSLYVVRHTLMPAVLVEGAFLSNKVENQLLRNDGYRQRIAEGLEAGILDYLGTMHPVSAPRLAALSTPLRHD